MSSLLRVELHRGVARLELLHPNGYPRLTRAVLAELESVFDSLRGKKDCLAVVIRGNDKCFAAGAEIAEVGALAGAAALAFSHSTQRLFDRIARFPKPVVAAVSGFCLGGGFDLALSCHWRLATPDAIFGHPGATLGLLTGWGGTQRLPRLIGRSNALELLLTGGQVNAAQALEFGLVSEVVAPEALLSRADAFALKLAAAAAPSSLPAVAPNA